MERISLLDSGNEQNPGSLSLLSEPSIRIVSDSGRDQGTPIPLTIRQLVAEPIFPQNVKMISSLPQLIRQRELNGNMKQLRWMTCRTRLNRLECPYVVQICAAKCVLNIARECIFIGLSNDSRYAVALVYPEHLFRLADEDEEGAQLCLIIFEFSAAVLRPAFITTFTQWPKKSRIHAKFSYNSSHISIIGFMKHNIEPRDTMVWRRNLEPFSVVVQVKFILFRFCITISMTSCLVMSCRWNDQKISRAILRSTDHGGILNAGTALISYLFTRDCPPVTTSRMSRTVLQVVDRSVVDDAEAQILNGLYSQDIEVSDATPYFTSNHREYGLKRITVEDKDPSPSGLNEPLFITESAMDIERLLYEIMPVFVSCMYANFKYQGLIDYEVDLLTCEQYIANIMVTAVIEATEPGSGGKNFPYVVALYIVWNTFEGTREISSFRGMRMIPWEKAYRPDGWYPFNNFPEKETAPGGRVLPIVPFLTDKRSEYLALLPPENVIDWEITAYEGKIWLSNNKSKAA